MKISDMSLKKRRVMIYFIEAARNIMIADGAAGLSIRRIAEAAGYNSATLYNYFEDLNHLVLYASMSYLRDYAAALGANIKPGMNAAEVYRTIYATFDEYAFKSPEIFYNMFFGPQSSKLSEVAEHYYELFPEELTVHSPAVRSMLSQGNMYLRDLPIAEELVKEGLADRQAATHIALILPRLNQTYLYEFIKAKDSGLTAEEQDAKFLAAFDYLIKTAKR